MNIPEDWIKVEVAKKFIFWLPPNLIIGHDRGIDSFVQQWKGNNIRIELDYGRFSDPLTLYSRKRSYNAVVDRVGGYVATVVSFQEDDGWNFVGIHFPDLGKDTFGQAVKMTLIMRTDPRIGKQIPLKIIESIEFSPS
jgi:hypothetical protein